MNSQSINRRQLLAASAALSGAHFATDAFAQSGPLLSPGLPSGVADSSTLEALPGKKPLIKLSYRPPNFETPVSVFRDAITPNDSFFVRWHLADIPEIDPSKWLLSVGGGANALSLTLDQLKSEFTAVEIVAVCQCSGNRRGLSNPHVPGVEWGYGAMGNAKWKGVRLKDILARAGVPQGAIEVRFNGADKPVLGKTPDFVKSIPLNKAMEDNTILAYEMNGAPLPHFNGAPARIIVPGWTATYWMKQVVSIDFLVKPEENFWMKAAYRVPAKMFPTTERFLTQETTVNTPITEIMVNSLITSHSDGEKVKAGTVSVRGIAWDGGAGIAGVEVSDDGGASWRSAKLGTDLGKYSFREWSFDVAATAGARRIMARASNVIGQTQPAKAIFNPAGYHHNVIHQITLDVA